jgi:MoaA/NifB/PqqE/SkfB family radical SAM enzyme
MEEREPSMSNKIDKPVDGSMIREKLDRLMARQEQLLIKQEMKFDELRQRIQEQSEDINAFLLQFQQINKDIQYVLSRLSVKERVKVRIFKLIQWARRMTRGKEITLPPPPVAVPPVKMKEQATKGSAEPLQDTDGRGLVDAKDEVIVRKMREIESYPLEISIIPNWGCNYHCTYCFAYKPKDRSEYRNHTAAEWEKALHSIYQRYGKCQLLLTGGEPLMYKDAVDLVINLTKYHYVSLGTNLSIAGGALKRILHEANIENLDISPSFHLEHTSIDVFIEKCLSIKEHGISVYSSAVCYPKYLPEMVKIKNKFEERGLWIGFFPFIGSYQGRTFPDEYSKEELEILGKLPGWHEAMKSETRDEHITLPRVKGVLCYTGVKFIFVNPYGDVTRCIPVNRILGNIFDPKLSLPQKPSPCPVDVCNCSVYWKYLVK